MNKILIVDDEENIVNVLKDYFEFCGYESDCAYDGLDALEKIKNNNYDCILTDIMMPNMDGYELVKRIKDFKDFVPVIMMSAKGEEYDKLTGFNLGIDDYVVKPFSLKEVVARVNAVTKRHKPKIELKEEKIEEGGILINLLAHSVFVEKEEIKLTNKEYELLLYLISNKNNAFSREQLGKAIWGAKPDKGDRTLDTHIKMLRAHLGSCGNYIKTVRGVGYKFER